MDVLSKRQRWINMSHIRGRDTMPEMAIRRLVYAMGYRYRLHVRRCRGTVLPGTPDLVFPGRKKVIFVHGCFWHRHLCKLGRPMPATRRAFWREKLEGNRLRDARQRRQLRRMRWKVLVVWECQTRPAKLAATTKRIRAFLDG